jgi:hypothetical protein
MNSFVGGGIGRNSSIRGRVGFTPKWMAINPKDYVNSTHKGVMATSRCGRDDLIGIQKESQSSCLPTSSPMVRAASVAAGQSQTQQTQQSNNSSSSTMRGMTAEQRKAKRKRELMTEVIGEINDEEDRRKRIRLERKEIERRSLPKAVLFRNQQF